MKERLRRPLYVGTIPDNEFVHKRLSGSQNIIWVNRASAFISIRMVDYQYDELKKSVLRMLRTANKTIEAPHTVADYDTHTQVLNFGFVEYKPTNNDNAVEQLRKIAKNIRMNLRKT